MDRRKFIKGTLVCAGSFYLLQGKYVWAETFLTIEEAQVLLWGETPMEKVDVVLTKAQAKAIAKAAKVRVRHLKIKAWRTPDNDWFLIDQVIGKHENIDMAVGITREGKVKGLEILTYRETYGHEVRHAKWRAQFEGRDASVKLKLGKQIRNISGATLSCRHVTDGIYRLTHTWDQVLKNL